MVGPTLKRRSSQQQIVFEPLLGWRCPLTQRGIPCRSSFHDDGERWEPPDTENQWRKEYRRPRSREASFSRIPPRSVSLVYSGCTQELQVFPCHGGGLPLQSP